MIVLIDYKGYTVPMASLRFINRLFGKPVIELTGKASKVLSPESMRIVGLRLKYAKGVK